MSIYRLEASVVHSICTQLENLGWVVDEKDPRNNVTQQRVKTLAQQERLKNANSGRLRFPDFVLYESGTNDVIGVIEAKRPGESLENALRQAEERYAAPLNAPLIFAYNDTFVATRYLHNSRSLKIDGEDIRQFIDHYTSRRFINEGSEILSAPQAIQLSRDELIKVFRRQANLLREAGLQAGLQRFGAFSDILFLKLMDEICQTREHAGADAPIPPHLRWAEFQNKSPNHRLEYVRDVVWKEMNKRYDNIFGHTFPIRSAEIFDDMVSDLSKLNFTVADVDVKGDAFEYFLKNAYQGIKIKDLGEYFTPRNIVRTMVSMANPKIGEKIYDPFCGTGGFLIEAFRYVSLRSSLSSEVSKILKFKTVYGSEIAATSRVARMNMVLYGDGHSNVRQRDSFANPVDGEYDVVLTNPPYSQSTRHGNLYAIPTKNGDAIAMQHCLKSLKDGGRAAILMKEDFLTKGGDIGKVRDMLLRSVNNISVVSLPRRLFEPYTPTKTSILYFEKGGRKRPAFFFVVKHVGHTFGARRQSTTANDLPNVLSAMGDFGNIHELEIDHHTEEKTSIEENKQSLWIYDYKEVLPPRRRIGSELHSLEAHIESSGKKFKPSDEADEEFHILGVSNKTGVFLNEVKPGREIKQPYIRVNAGDFVYNPHRVNVGSIGVAPKQFDGGIVSGIYVVFRLKTTSAIPPYYLLYLLKSPAYRSIIQAYDSKNGAVRANLTWDQLKRIKFYLPNQDEIDLFTKKQKAIVDLREQASKLENELLTEYFG